MSLNERDFISSIRRLWRFAEGIKVGEQFSGPTPLRPSAEFRTVSLSGDTTYEEVYLCGLKNRDYNILLRDYSYFQMSRATGTMRLAFFPNPFFGTAGEALAELSEKQEYVTEGVISIEEYLHEISELRSAIQPPVVRYEFDPAAYVEDRHPAAHFHIGYHSDNRWPCSKILTPEAFGLLLLKLYYAEDWFATEEVRVEGIVHSPFSMLCEARNSCPSVGDEFFSDAEGRSFHLT